MVKSYKIELYCHPVEIVENYRIRAFNCIFLHVGRYFSWWNTLYSRKVYLFGCESEVSCILCDFNVYLSFIFSGHTRQRLPSSLAMKSTFYELSTNFGCMQIKCVVSISWLVFQPLNSTHFTPTAIWLVRCPPRWINSLWRILGNKSFDYMQIRRVVSVFWLVRPGARRHSLRASFSSSVARISLDIQTFPSVFSFLAIFVDVVLRSTSFTWKYIKNLNHYDLFFVFVSLDTIPFHRLMSTSYNMQISIDLNAN